MSELLKLKDVTMSYNGDPVLKGVSFGLKKGDIGCLLGPSGCGKTTVLRTIAGLERLSGGEISLNGKTVSSSSYALAPEKRKVGMIFQDYALFPHLSVEKNVAFGIHRLSKAEQSERVSTLLETVGLEGSGRRYPHELSGGQQQRLALARALAPRPELLLMDEPFSNLDVTLREKLSAEVRDILKRNGITALLVTHNHLEAFAVADKIGILNDGVLEQWDTAHNIYHLPSTTFVADFIGEGTLVKGRVISQNIVSTALGVLEGRFISPCDQGCDVEVLIRPDDIIHDDESPVGAIVISKAFRGANMLYSLQLGSGEKVLSLAPSHHDHPVGSEIGIKVEVEDIVLFTRDPAVCPEDVCRVG